MPRQEKHILRALTSALVKSGAIETSEARVRRLRSFLDRILTKAKKGDVASRREIAALLGQDEKTVRRLVNEIAPRFSDRISGFTRTKRLGRRRGDASMRVKIEWSGDVQDLSTKRKRD